MDKDIQNEIIRLLGKLSDKIDEVHKDLSAIEARLASLETWKEAQTNADSHFWSVSWPSQAEIVKSVEERVRVVERERVSLQKMEDMEKAVNQLKLLTPVESKVDALEKRVGELETFGTKMRVAFGVMAFIGGSAGTVLTQFLMKGALGG